MSKTRQGGVGLLALLAVLLLVACGAGGESQRPGTSAEPPAVVAATLAPGQEAVASVPAAGVPTAIPSVTPPAPLAATVNGQYIFLADYERRVAQYERAMLQQGSDPNSNQGQTDLAQARQDILDGMIDGLLIEQAAAALHIGITDTELEGKVEADIAAGGGQSAFDEWLAATGQTRDDYKAMLRESWFAQQVMDAVTAGVPTEAEQVHARHILVDSEQAAQQVLTMLQQSADFATLARERSLDEATKDSGGDLSWFPRGAIAPELETAVFALQPGQVSGIVRLGDEYDILQVVEREAARPLSPEIQADMKFALFDEWLAQQRASAVIERHVTE